MTDSPRAWPRAASVIVSVIGIITFTGAAGLTALAAPALELLQRTAEGACRITGKITGISDDGVLVIELQEKVRVRIPRAYIEGKWEGKVPDSANKAA
jgi:hypothetical protein